MPTNHYKNGENHFQTDDLPEDIQSELSSTFSPDVIYALLRDTYYRGPYPVGKGGERYVSGGGKPGTGLRRPDGPFYDYSDTWRQSVLRKALDLDLVVLVAGDDDTLDASGNFYAASERGVELLFDLDRCPDCSRVNRPVLKQTRRNVYLKTTCPVHGGGESFERDDDALDRVSNLRNVECGGNGWRAYENDDAPLRAFDPDGLRDELAYGDLVETEEKYRDDSRGVVVEPDTVPSNALGPVNDYTADENEEVVVYLNDEGEFSGHTVVSRTSLRLVEDGADYVEEVPVFTEGAKVRTAGSGVSKEVVEVRGDYYAVRYPSSNPYSEGEQSTSVYHALELSPATRRIDLPDPEFEEGDEVRHLPVRDRDEDFKLGVACRVARVVEEDYDDERGFYYVLNYAESGDYHLGTYGRNLLPEADARERDPDADPFEEGDYVTVEDTDDEESRTDLSGVWRVYDEPTPSVERNTYSYRLVPESVSYTASSSPRGKYPRTDHYTRHEHLSRTFECSECGTRGNEETEVEVYPRPTAPAGSPDPEYQTLCDDCK